MDYISIEGLELSRLALGTAQLGLEYGIANSSGRPERGEANDIIELALDSGINTFDTAPAYGQSEEILGDFLKDKAKDMNIITKIPPVEHQDSYEFIKNSLSASASKLNIEKIPIALFHRASDQTAHGRGAIESLVRLKDEGFVNHIGTSVYSPGEVRALLDEPELDTIEIPINLFDLRLIESGLLNELASQGKIVLARSVYLQGLFFLKPSGLTTYLTEARQPLEDLMRIAKEHQIDIAEMALSFVRDMKEVTSLIIGAETTEQLDANITLMSSPRLSTGVRQQILDTFTNLPESVINPRMWK